MIGSWIGPGCQAIHEPAERGKLACAPAPIGAGRWVAHLQASGNPNDLPRQPRPAPLLRRGAHAQWESWGGAGHSPQGKGAAANASAHSERESSCTSCRALAEDEDRRPPEGSVPDKPLTEVPAARTDRTELDGPEPAAENPTKASGSQFMGAERSAGAARRGAGVGQRASGGARASAVP